MSAAQDGAKSKEDLVKAFEELRNYHRDRSRHFEKLRSQASKLSLKLEAEPDISTEGSNEEVGARYKAWCAVRQRNNNRSAEYDTAYASLFKQLEEERKTPAQESTFANGNSVPTIAQNDEEKSQEQENVNVNPPSADNAENPERPSELHFDQVYQGGKADPKEVIVEHPKDSGIFYILRCDQCQLAPFAYADPLRAAGKHLDTAQHGFLKRSNDNAVKNLGIRVFNCTKALVEKNNEAYKRWFDTHQVQRARQLTNRQKQSPKVTTKLKEARRPRKKRSLVQSEFGESYVGIDSPLASKRRRGPKFVEPGDIKAGEVYCFSNDKGTYNSAIVILPLFEEWPSWKAEVLRTPEAVGCYSNDAYKPPADLFEVHPETRIPKDWAHDFRGGGPRFQERKYPAVFIQGEQWKESRTSFDWVPSNKIGPYAEEQVMESERKGVADYLRKRDAAQHRNESTGDGSRQDFDPQFKQTEDDETDIVSSGSDAESPCEEEQSPQRHEDTNSPPAQQNIAPHERLARPTTLQGAPSNGLAIPPTRHEPSFGGSRKSRSKASVKPEMREENIPPPKLQPQPQLASRSPNNARRFGKRSYGGLWNTSSAPPKYTHQVDVSSDDDSDIPDERPSFPRLGSDTNTSSRSPHSFSFGTTENEGSDTRRLPAQRPSSSKRYLPSDYGF